MSIEQLQADLLKQIKSIRNREQLLAISDLISSSNKLNKLTESQKEMLSEGINDVHSGKIVAQDQLDNEDLLWLDEK